MKKKKQASLANPDGTKKVKATLKKDVKEKRTDIIDLPNKDLKKFLGCGG